MIEATGPVDPHETKTLWDAQPIIPMTETVLQEAERIVGGNRRQDYGGARGSFDKIAAVWAAILDVEVTGEQVALCMIGLKLIRESHAHKRDNVVDIAGYARCIEKMGDGG